MRFREWFGDRHEEPQPDVLAGNPAGGSLDRLRQDGDEFLAAADEAINQALSSNSEEFLAANRQQGGQ